MKNIVLVITDTFRYDNLHDDPEMTVNTPELRRFAATRATSVERFYAGSFPTIPHRTDIASGVLGWPHYGWQPLERSGPNHIGRILRQAGYVTQLICDCPHLFNAGFQSGFHAAFQHRGQEGDIPLLHLNDPIQTLITDHAKTRQRPQNFGHPLAHLHRWTNRYCQSEEGIFCYRTSTTTVRWLEENYKAKPFFLWVDFFDPHEPWDPPEYMVRKYQAHYEKEAMIHPNYGPASVYEKDELINLRAHYAAEAELVDRAIGRVLQKIDDLRLWNNTIVLVTSDHGTSLGEHNRTGKSNICDEDDRFWPIYPEVGHVPFLIAGAGIPRGESRSIFGQPIDALPTLCQLAGVDADPPQPFEGVSLAESILHGGPGPRQLVVSGSFAKARRGDSPRRAVTPFLITEHWGYTPVGADGQPELYQIDADPLAATNVADGNSAVVKQMQQALEGYLRDCGATDEFIAYWCYNAGEGTTPIDYAH